MGANRLQKRKSMIIGLRKKPVNPIKPCFFIKIAVKFTPDTHKKLIQYTFRKRLTISPECFRIIKLV